MRAASTDPHRLGDGAAGTALVLVERARRGLGSWEDAHHAITTATAAPIDASAGHIGLFSGAPAVGFLLHRAGRPGYASALDALDEAIDTATRTRLTHAHERIKRGEPTSIGEYDLISGLTGLGLYQLVRHHGAGLLPDIVDYLVALTQPLRLDGRWLPGWWCADGPAGIPSPGYPDGHANLGMAHGIAGVLALLSATMIAGIDVPGHQDAIDRICAYLDRWRQQDDNGTWWPETLTRAEHDQHRPTRTGPGRPSWCYGIPGIARAQQLAGRALGDPSRTRGALTALADALADERQLRRLTDAGLCHGWAGLRHATRRVAADSPDPASWRPTLQALRRRLDDHLAQHGTPDDVGLIDGRAGLDLIEITEGTASAAEEDWDTCLLLTFPTPNRHPDPATQTRTP